MEIVVNDCHYDIILKDETILNSDIEKLLKWYDFEAVHIDNSNQRKKVFKSNRQIKERLLELGVMKFNKIKS